MINCSRVRFPRDSTSVATFNWRFFRESIEALRNAFSIELPTQPVARREARQPQNNVGVLTIPLLLYFPFMRNADGLTPEEFVRKSITVGQQLGGIHY